jgi:hypothetical protein
VRRLQRKKPFCAGVVIIKAEHSEMRPKHYYCMIKTEHSVSAVITANKGKDNA